MITPEFVGLVVLVVPVLSGEPDVFTASLPAQATHIRGDHGTVH
ncbi:MULTISPECIES: hypothetical protein [unclassified Nocardia]